MKIESPCIGLCTVEPEDGVCRGCFRTLDEIRQWTSMTDGQREEVMQRLGVDEGEDA